MEWTYRITATSGPRVLMRVVQLFDNQRLAIRSLSLKDSDGRVDILINADTATEQARRIHAKLYHQVDILQVELTAGWNGDVETVPN